MNEKMAPGVTSTDLKQLAERARLIAKPINFEQLIEEGLLRKAGAWYEALGADKLPEHVTAKVRAMQTRNGKVFFKFSSTSGAEKLIKQLERLGF